MHALNGMFSSPGGEYYINGMYPLTCLIDAPELREIREQSVAKILRHVGRNGTIGGDIPDTAVSGQKVNYWGRMIAVLALETYVECTGPFAPNTTMQQKVEVALLRHYTTMHSQIAAQRPAFWTDVWGSARYAEILVGVQWMIDRGHKDSFLWELLHLVRGKSEELLGWEQWFESGNPFEDTTTDTLRCWGNKTDPGQANWQKHHGVTIMEAIKTGPLWYRVSGDGVDRNNTAAALQWIDKYAYSADGTFTAPDCLNAAESEAHSPTSGVETCSVVESMFSLRTAYEITGSVDIYDRLERVAFNSMPATTDQLFGGNAYYHSLNQMHLGGTP